MVLNCHDLWRHVSNYIDGDLDPRILEDIELHLAQCRHCAALVDSTHNIIVLVADKRVFALPVGFSERLQARLMREIASSR